MRGPEASRWPHQARPGLDSARARVLHALAEDSSRQGATVESLTGTLGGHPNTVRHHLLAALRDGLVEREASASVGPGRPAVRYRLTRAGTHALAPSEDLNGQYAALAMAFAENLAGAAGVPGNTARSVGAAWGAALVQHEGDGPGHASQAGSISEIVAVLDHLGFSPRVVHSEDPSVSTVLLRTCPLLDAARRHPEVVCQVHRGLVEGLMDRDEVDVELRPFDQIGSCTLSLLTPTGRPSGGSPGLPNR